MIPSIFICQHPPNENGQCTAISHDCLAQRQDNWQDFENVCKAMQKTRKLQEKQR